MPRKKARTVALDRRTIRVATLALGLLSLIPTLGIGGCQTEFSTPRALADLSNRRLTGRFARDTPTSYLLVVTLSYQAPAGECFHLLPEVVVELNGAPMEGTLGFTTDTGGCQIPHFQRSMPTLPADPAAHLVIADSTLTLNMDVDDLFGPRSMSIRPPADGSSLTPSQTVWLDLAPAQDLAPPNTVASMVRLTFTQDGAFTSAFDLTNDSLMIAGASLGFTVPSLPAAASGTLYLSTRGPVPVTRCEGAELCDVQAIYDRSLPATIGPPI